MVVHAQVVVIHQVIQHQKVVVEIHRAVVAAVVVAVHVRQVVEAAVVAEKEDNQLKLKYKGQSHQHGLAFFITNNL
jgi:hypothetical protein